LHCLSEDEATYPTIRRLARSVTPRLRSYTKTEKEDYRSQEIHRDVGNVQNFSHPFERIHIIPFETLSTESLNP